MRIAMNNQNVNQQHCAYDRKKNRPVPTLNCEVHLAA
jgi:hypothetical protein